MNENTSKIENTREWKITTGKKVFHFKVSRFLKLSAGGVVDLPIVHNLGSIRDA